MNPTLVARHSFFILRARSRPVALAVVLCAGLLSGLRPVAAADEQPAAEAPPTVAEAAPSWQRLWDGPAPGAHGQAVDDIPRLQVYLPAEPDPLQPGVVVCPGGGYGHLALGHEGEAVGRWLNQHGIAAFVLDYRHAGKGYHHPAPLTDAQRAMRWVRHRAAELQVAQNRLGIMGFSAGGHLASSVVTHFDAGDSAAEDPVDRHSCRPDFAILCYPVIAWDEPYTHRGSQQNLLGSDAPAELVESLSSEKQVTDQCPPTFLFHTTEDQAVPVENSLVFYRALTEHSVPAELHVFQQGRHGVGLAAQLPGAQRWPELCLDWLSRLGVVGSGREGVK